MYRYNMLQNYSYSYNCFIALCILSGTTRVSQYQKGTKSPAVARMADTTALVVKLTLILTPTVHNLAKTGTSPLNGPIMRQNKAH